METEYGEGRALDAARDRARPERGQTGANGINVGQTERMLSAIGGGVLALYGLKRRGVDGAALALLGGLLAHRGVTGHCHVYQALDMNTADARGGPEKKHGRSAVLDASHAVKVEHAVTIDLPADVLYRFWRNFEQLPQVMGHLESVEVIDERRSRWRAKAPGGQTIEWDAVVHNEIPNRLIAWKSVDGAAVPNAGSVHFTPAASSRGTEVRVILEYQPPAGKLGQLVAKAFGEEPELQVREDLRRFKWRMEAGTGSVV